MSISKNTESNEDGQNQQQPNKSSATSANKQEPGERMNMDALFVSLGFNIVKSRRKERDDRRIEIEDDDKTIANCKTISPELIDEFNEYLKSKLNENDPNNNKEIKFPVDKLAKLDDMINKPRWIIPVLPKGILQTTNCLI